jgi:hypothetical protein
MAKLSRPRNAAGNPIAVVFLQDSSSTTGAGLTGLTFSSSGLKVTVKRELDSATTNYSSAGSTIETITTIGTYAAPTATKVRFKEIDATNWPGWYELQFAQALFGTGDASRFLSGEVFGATNLAPCPFEIQLDTNEPADVMTLIGTAGVGLTNVGLRTLDTHVLQSGTAQAGAAGTITLAAGASAVDDFYKGAQVVLYGGTGANQAPRIITAYNGTTKVATVGRNWVTNPDNTSTYKVFAIVAPKVDDNLRIDVGSVAGTAQTARDIGATLGVAGVGLTNLGDARIGADTGGVTTLLARIPTFPANFSALVISAGGVINAAMVAILGTTLTETAGQLAAGFKKFFNVGAPTSDMNRITLVDTTTNSTNAPTVGDLTNTMKASVTAAVPTAAQIRIEMDGNSTQLSSILTNIANLSNLSAFANIFGPSVMEIPDAGTSLMTFTAVFKDADGHLVDVDTNTVTLAITNAAGASRAANLSAVTHASTGVYTFNYTVTAGDAKESLRLVATAAVAGAARRADFNPIVEDFDTASSIATILSTAAAIKVKTDALPADPTSEAAATANKVAVLARIGTPNGASLAADVAEVAADTDALITTAAGHGTQLTEIAGDTDTLLTGQGTIGTQVTEIATDTDTLLTGQTAVAGQATEIAADTDALITSVGALPGANAIVTAVFARAFGANFQNKTFAQLQEAMAATLFGPSSGAGTTEEVFHDLTGGVKVTVDNNSVDRTATVLA